MFICRIVILELIQAKLHNIEASMIVKPIIMLCLKVKKSF